MSNLHLHRGLQFITGENGNICRLCLEPCSDKQTWVDTFLMIDKHYYNGYVTVIEMLEALGIPTEPLLPQMLCSDCLTLVIDSYLLHKLCEYSKESWENVLNKLDQSLELAGKKLKAQTAFLVMSKDNTVVTSQSTTKITDKTSALNKLTVLLKNRSKYRNKYKNSKCKICGITVRSKNFKRHLRLHTTSNLIYKGPIIKKRTKGNSIKRESVSSDSEENEDQRSSDSCDTTVDIVSIPKSIKTPSVAVAVRIHGMPLGSNVKCVICGLILRRASFRRHLILKHNTDGDHTCKVCSKVFTNAIKLSNHFLQMHAPKTIQCEKCSKMFRTKQILKIHDKIHHKPNDIWDWNKTLCVICGESVKKRHLHQHLKAHDELDCTCKDCFKVFDSAAKLSDHILRVHAPKKYQCDKCSDMFSTEPLLNMHYDKRHKPVVCKLCSLQLPSKMALRGHLDKHGIVKCPKCNKSFKHRGSLIQHSKICGNEENRKISYYCDLCNKGFFNRKGIQKHIATHGFGNFYPCSWCDKKFHAVSKLKMHIVKHTKERNFHCEICGNNFVTQPALTNHIRLHTGERPFPCDLCDERFLSASRRMEHKRRMHLGREQECDICNAKFLTPYALRKHKVRHFNPQSKLYIKDKRERERLKLCKVNMQMIAREGKK